MFNPVKRAWLSCAANSYKPSSVDPAAKSQCHLSSYPLCWCHWSNVYANSFGVRLQLGCVAALFEQGLDWCSDRSAACLWGRDQTRCFPEMDHKTVSRHLVCQVRYRSIPTDRSLLDECSAGLKPCLPQLVYEILQNCCCGLNTRSSGQVCRDCLSGQAGHEL